MFLKKSSKLASLVSTGPNVYGSGSYHIWPEALFQKVISENRIRSGLREVVDSFYENLTAITERDGTLSEACR